MTVTDEKRLSLARGEGLPQPLLLEDPMESLPPTAQRILAAAQRLLASGGFEALKLSAIAREAGESKASIGYHFGNKAGLVTALVDALTHEANRGLIAETAAVPAGEARVRALIDGETRIIGDAEAFQSFFEVLPHALRDPDLRERVAALYDGYRETVLRCLDAEDEEARRRLRPFADAHDRHRRRAGAAARPRPGRRTTWPPPRASGSSWPRRSCRTPAPLTVYPCGMDAAVIWHEDYALHDTGQHPEGPDRVDAIVVHLKGTDLWPRLAEIKPEPATEDDILLVHARTHLNIVKRAAQSGGQWLDPDTYVSPQQLRVALLSAGGAIEATRLWERGLVPFALIRPPGHHAAPDRAMGFCLFNNVAIAAARAAARARRARRDRRLGRAPRQRHPGDLLRRARACCSSSMHQWPLYPGTGAFASASEGEAAGHHGQHPPAGGLQRRRLPARASTSLVEPVVRQFAPQAILVSAGEDIHRLDPLGGMEVTEAGFAGMALRCLRLAQELVRGPAGLHPRGRLRPGGDRPGPSRPSCAPCSTRRRPRWGRARIRARPRSSAPGRRRRQYWDV